MLTALEEGGGRVKRSEEWIAGFRAGFVQAGLEARAERNRIARLCADAHDERDEERRQHAATRDLLSIRDNDLEALRDEFERATGRDWTEEQARSWSS